jgi:hypothetical protein
MPFQEHILEPLSSRGYYVGARCGVAATEAALFHSQAGAFHMTGGTATHDAIVWGGDPGEQSRRKAIGDPKLKVPQPLPTLGLSTGYHWVGVVGGRSQ